MLALSQAVKCVTGLFAYDIMAYQRDATFFLQVVVLLHT